MKLMDITVYNFRSINGESVTLSLEDSDIIFVFGQNNAGKSTLLSAYEYLITPKQKAIISDFLGYEEIVPIQILATFSKDEGDDLIFAEKGFDKWVDKEGKLKFRKTWSNKDTEGQKETFDPIANDYITNGFGGLEQHLTKQAPTPIRIPAILTQSELTKFIKDIIQKSVLKTLKDEESEAYQNVLNEIEALQQKILSKDAISSKSALANNNFQKIFPDLTLEISQIEGDEFDLPASLEKEYSVIIKDKKFPTIRQDFSNHGHGVIRQTLFNFLGIVKNELSHKAGEFTNRKDFLILFEEPEIYLHPKAINLLRKVLYDLCSNSNFQIICASHSPALIDISKPHTSLVRMVRKDDGKTYLYQVGKNLFNSTTEQKEMVQMINRFNPNICESFFADEVILVEGDTEAIVIRELLATKFPGKDLFITNTGSKNNMPFFQKIFTHFHIHQHIIHDSDTRFVYEITKNKHNSVIYIPKTNADGSYKSNSAWKLNAKIWEEIEKANSYNINSCRYVSVYNFEMANNYVRDNDKGKPLSAFTFVKETDKLNNSQILQFVNQIVGLEPKQILYSEIELETIVKEPK